MKSLSAALICAAMVLPFAAFAQMSDTDYCNALAAKYRQTIGGSNQTYSGVPEAIAACGSNPKGSIPTLENVLKDNKVDLPKRM